MRFYLDTVATAYHRAQVVENAGYQYQRDVHDEKANEGCCTEKMKGASTLSSAEKFGEPRSGGVDTGCHGQPRQNHDWQQPEQHQKIGQLLDTVVVSFVMKTQPRMIK